VCILITLGDIVYLVEAVLRPEKTADVIAALAKFGHKDDILISDVKGRRREVGEKVVREYRGHTFVMDVQKTKTKMELITDEEHLEDIISTITNSAKTGNYGDGKIFVYPVIDYGFGEGNKSSKNLKGEDEGCGGNPERDELLKKLGIKLPDDEYIDNLISKTFEPDKLELRTMEKTAIDELSCNLFDILKEQDMIHDYALNVEVEYENGIYHYRCNVILIPKRTLGVLKKKINMDSIRKRTEDILKSISVNAKYDISIKSY